MTITLEIAPRVQAELARRAAVSGSGVEAHAASLLEEALHLSPSETDTVPLGRKLVETFAKAKVLLAGDELNLDRDASPGRSVELS